MTQVARRYTVDLVAMHALYELNYARVQTLLQGIGLKGVGISQQASPLIEFSWGHEALQLSRVERTKYTETWRLAQITPVLPWCPELDMEVRLYHDARMADVQRFQSARRIPAIVAPGHVSGWRANEKQLVNHFLGDCLHHCLHYGLPRDPRLQPDFSRWDAGLRTNDPTSEELP